MWRYAYLMSPGIPVPRLSGESAEVSASAGAARVGSSRSTVAWLYSPSIKGSGWMRTRDFTFGVAILDYDPAPDEELRAVLQKWADTFEEDSFTRDVSSQGVNRVVGGPMTLLQSTLTSWRVASREYYQS